MTIETQYAQALYELVTKDPIKSEMYLGNLQKTLKAKGHQKLLPRIFAEFKTILDQKERSKKYSLVTPEQERTRNLLELYRKLVTSQ